MEPVTIDPPMLSRESAVYTSCYCEENIWKLCEWIRDNQANLINSFYAVIISNDEEKVPIWMQQSGDESIDGFVIWDYHVILIYDGKPVGDKPLVYDLDTLLSFPVSLTDYLETAIQDEQSLKPEYHRCFRVIPANQYLTSFASDRSRMKTQDGGWLRKPPDYPPIQTSNCTNNLNELISMDQGKCSIGKVMNLDQLRNYFLS